ncbi:hypothetical protein ACLKA7_001746 [Drosophila subpalustris]
MRLQQVGTSRRRVANLADLKAYHTELEPDAQPETGPGLSAPETTPSLSNSSKRYSPNTNYMASRPDESSEAEGIVLGERAGHSGQYPCRPHDADYIIHSPYNSDQSRATTPNAGVGDMEAFHGADGDWGLDEESGPQRLPNSSAIAQ